MKLKRYLDLNGISKSEFAEKAGLNLSDVCRYLATSRKPNLVAMNKIRIATKGKVDVEDFLDV